MTPDERARLMTNFRGYDIAPDMVRLSRVNLYLHGFPNPTIHEYDALTSEDRWDERCDVIMANPPFMTPKGGIRPHNRFSIKARRSEVLFVDYIAEHLTPSGRAGVIVPEGIIFQGQNAYKNLRRMLVEGYLWAVVSLPSGVFNPYAGVKTSILFMDRNLVKRTDLVLFVKIENDGFDLGAQRRPIEGSQLAEALAILERHKTMPEAQEGKLALTVPRTRLLESPDINLSGDRYRTAAVRHTGKWPMVRLGEVCTFEYGASLPERNRVVGQYPVVGSNGIAGYHNSFIVKGPTIVIGRKGSAGEVNWIDDNCFPIDTTYFISLKLNEISLRYLFYTLQQLELTKLRGGAGVPGLNRNDAYDTEIPLPPLEEQERIVAELDGYRKVIEGARQVLASYKPTIRIDPEWPSKPMGEVCDVRDGTHDSPKYHLQGFPLITSKNIKNGHIDFENTDLISKEDLDKINKRSFVADGDILMPMIGTIGNPIIVQKDREFAVKNVALIKFFKTSEVDRHYLKSVLESDLFSNHLLRESQGSSQKFVSLGFLRSLAIPLPPLSIQREIVAELEAERKLVEANRELIRRMEARIKAKLDEVWGG